MAEDDVERLVAEIESKPPFHFCNKCGAMYEGGTPTHAGCNYVAAGTDPSPKRLARIVRELLAEFPLTVCFHDGKPKPLLCDNCRARALRGRLCRIARGEA